MGVYEVIINLLIALFIIAAVSAMGAMGYSYLRLSTTEQSLVTLKLQTQDLFSGTDYTGLNNDVAIASGIVPETFLKGNILKNAWGGNLTLTPIPANATFSIELSDIPKSVCPRLARQNEHGWKNIFVNGNDIIDADVPTITASCVDTNTLTFIAY